MQTHSIHPALPTEDLERVAALFKALSDPTRLHLLLHLMGGEYPVSALVQALEQPQSTVSRHLALLRQAHLVQTRRALNRVYYRLADAHLAHLLTEAFSHAQRLGLPDHPGPASSSPTSSMAAQTGRVL